MATKIALIIEYDGSRYYGSQFQLNAPTIQGEVEKALKKLTGEAIRIVIASRTDAGVHAKGQVISFRTRSAFPPEVWVKALNFYLPMDIAVKAAHQVSEEFDARRDALKRVYQYYILNDFTRSPLMGRFAYFFPKPLDIEAMREASKVLIGEHDLAPFSSLEENTRRTIYKAEITRKDSLVVFEMAANSFLPHQVRNTVGGLIKVGSRKMAVEEFHRLARSGKVGVIGPSAPVHGLCLVRVEYPDPLLPLGKNENL